MKIGVVGVGYLGAVHATALASIGFDVTATDVDDAKVASLNAGKATFHEPGFDDLLARTVDQGSLRFTTDPTELADHDVVFLCVGTPQVSGGSAADLSQVWSAVADLAPHLAADAVLVGKSTVPVGTAARIADFLVERGSSATVVWNPEFLREGFAVRDTLEPDRIVVGAPDDAAGARAVDLLREVYAAPLAAGTPLLVTDVATAELVKAAANAFLATKISFINAMAEICDEVGADVTQLADAIGHDSRIGSQFLKAGVGFGGGCLPKDIRAFRARSAELGVGQALDFLDDVDDINRRSRSRARDAALGALEGVDEPVVTVLGAAFKPDSDDTRDSAALDIAAQLAATGAAVRVHDPAALATAARVAPQLDYRADLSDALAGADLVMVLTEWREYRDLDPDEAGRLVRRRRVIDGRNCLPAQSWADAGWHWSGMGVPDRLPAPATVG